MPTVVIAQHRVKVEDIDTVIKERTNAGWILYVHEKEKRGVTRKQFKSSPLNENDLRRIWDDLYEAFRDDCFVTSENICFRPESVMRIDDEPTHTPPRTVMYFRFGLRLVRRFETAQYALRDAKFLRDALRSHGIVLPSVQ